jgi:hypothetical protein
MYDVPKDKNVEEKPDVSLVKDSQWSVIDGELCRVIDFIPMATIENGKLLALDRTIPYATVVLECKKLPTKIRGFITNKLDFVHLWSAFRERTIKQDEEVLIIWSKKQYKNIIYNIFSTFMPKLWVLVCPKNAFELETNINYRPELQGEARWNASKPIIDWKPEVMK